MSAQQAQLLCVVGSCLPTMGEAGSLMRIEKSSLSGLVQRAELAGLVERERDGGDGRTQRLKLTAHGNVCAKAFKAAVVHDLCQILETLSEDDKTSLSTILPQIVAARDTRQWAAAPLPDAGHDEAALDRAG
ncbi:MarR family winged helix-turn-helix transcriptional regulator [Pararhizobium polonicum]|uniref:MarR family winged helix-turn-helix transcriptional regulator n=1 Tax=Pararhizobium polonicum TaxID=1612624 RepID=UPI001314ABFF|nr:MarR family winged helix-turn-helix transcriptional regulator [Pararhizobium polonicum]